MIIVPKVTEAQRAASAKAHKKSAEIISHMQTPGHKVTATQPSPGVNDIKCNCGQI